MAAHIVRTEPLGDGQVQVWGMNPGGNLAHVIVGLDRMADGTVYTMLQIAADKIDKKARDLDRQSILDSEVDT